MISELLHYTKVADERVIQAFENSEAIPEAEKLFSHVLNAQHIWTYRIKGCNPLYDRLQVHHRYTFRDIHLENHKHLTEIIETADLDKSMRYQQADGNIFTNKVSDILFHVVNHSTYHRAQIATLFRKNDILVPVTDFIILKREELL